MSALKAFRKLRDAWESFWYRRWLRSPEGQEYIRRMSFLAEHGVSETIHALSPDCYERWKS